MKTLLYCIAFMIGPWAFASESLQEVKLFDGLKLEALSKEDSTLPSSQQSLIMDSESSLVVANQKIRFYSLAKHQYLDSKPLALPATCTRLATSTDPARAQRSLYCFGKLKGKGDNILLYSKGGRFQPFVETPHKIAAVTGDSNRVFFVSRDGLFQIRIQEGIKPVFVSSFLSGVQSMTLDSKHDVLFLASADQVFSLRGGVLDVLAKGLGGQVTLIGENLLVQDKSGRIWRVNGLDELIVKEKSTGKH